MMHRTIIILFSILKTIHIIPRPPTLKRGKTILDIDAELLNVSRVINYVFIALGNSSKTI